MIVTYRTDPAALAEVVPETLAFAEALVKYEFIRMADSTGFGDYTESGQVIPMTFQGQEGSYVHGMYLDDEAPIAGGRELWRFPKKLASRSLAVEKDTLLGALKYGSVTVAVATMGYKHRTLDGAPVKTALTAPNFLLKIVPHVDGTARICELVLLRRRNGERRLERPRRTGAVSSRTRSRSAVARRRSALRRPHRLGFHAWAGHCRP